MSSRVSAARKEMRRAFRDLRSLAFRLQGIVASLPAQEEETSREGDMTEGAYSEEIELRLAAQCVVRDQLEPAMAALRNAVKYRARKARRPKESA